MLPRPCRKCGRPQRNGPYCAGHEPPPRAVNPAYHDPVYTKNKFIVVARARRDGTPCCICHRPFLPAERITVEHKLPLRLGGSHDLSNLGPAHSACNTAWNKKKPR